MLTPTLTPATNILTLDPDEPAAVFFRQALGLPDDVRLTVLVNAPATSLTLLFEVFSSSNLERPLKRYLFCNDPAHPERVTAVNEAKARELIGLLSHPEIRVTPLPAVTAIAEYERLELVAPSYETTRNGAPRTYDPPALE